MSRDTMLAVLMLTAVAFLIIVSMKWSDNRRDPEWYKYKVTVTDIDGVMYYGVETMDNEFLGEVTASRLDSLIADYNQ